MNVRLSEILDYQKDLNLQQLNIVREGDGPCLVVAGAGSGKTRVLVYRVCWLLENGVPASSILLVTFTNRAAGQMIERIEELLGDYPEGLWAGTFHHTANTLLRKYGRFLNIGLNYTILDEEDSISILKKITQHIADEEDFPVHTTIKKILSFSVNTSESIRDIINTRFPQYSCFIPRLEAISTRYQKRKREQNLVDYDDLLLFWHRLMKNENIGMEISKKFKYILVDEYHDTNKLQSLILYQLAKTGRNIMVVGDDAQSIYSFRGATVNNIMEFPKIYSEARTFCLDLNYRSTPQILDFANRSISHNRFQFPKDLRSIRKSGIKPVLIKCYNPGEEAAFVAQRISQLLRSGIAAGDIGVLFRSMYQVAEVEMEMSKLKIPYIVRGGLRFFEQAHIKDMVAYFRAAENLGDEIAWKRVFGLTDGIGAKTTRKLLGYMQGAGSLTEFCHRIENADLDTRALRSFGKLAQLLKKIRETEDIPSAIDMIMDAGYSVYLGRRCDDDIKRYEDLKMLKEISSTFTSLSDFISESSLQEYCEGEGSSVDDPVTLSTIHQAKGLEWKIVFLIGVCSNHFPHPSSCKDIMELEEERRIFYVGLTRAKEDIYITYYVRDSCKTFADRRSVFLEEIPHSFFEEWNFRMQ